MSNVPAVVEVMQETIAQQDRLIESQRLTVIEYQRQLNRLGEKYNVAVDRIKELEDIVANRVPA